MYVGIRFYFSNYYPYRRCYRLYCLYCFIVSSCPCVCRTKCWVYYIYAAFLTSGPGLVRVGFVAKGELTYAAARSALFAALNIYILHLFLALVRNKTILHGTQFRRADVVWKHRFARLIWLKANPLCGFSLLRRESKVIAGGIRNDDTYISFCALIRYSESNEIWSGC